MFLRRAARRANMRISDRWTAGRVPFRVREQEALL